MKANELKIDLELAQRVCKELRSNNSGAIAEIFELFSSDFSTYCRCQLYDSDPDTVADVVGDFWVALLKNKGRVICHYKGERASLKTYLKSILHRKLLDFLRKKKRRQNIIGTDPKSPLDPPNSKSSVTIYEKEECRKIIREAILIFEETFPKEASRIWCWAMGLSYKEMVMKELAGRYGSTKEINSKESAIRKQFTRPKTGTFAKFNIILERYLQTKKLNLNEFANDCCTM